jgi:hypothetical protein
MYWHIDFGMWPKEVVDKLRNEGRRPPTIPVIPDKIETLVGSVVANGFDVSFEANEPSQDDIALQLQDMYYSDRNECSWGQSEIESMLNACIYAGYERMVLDFTHNPFGNIAWESLNPRHILLDPAWKTNKVGDLGSYIVFNDLLPTQIMAMYPEVAEKLLHQWDVDKGGANLDYGTNLGAVPEAKAWEQKWGSYHRVIEFHHVKRTNGFWEWDKKNGCWFPETGYKENSSDDKMAKLVYIQEHELGVDDIAMVPRTRNVAYIETIVPSLSNAIFLSEGLDPIQTGNINLYPLGIRYNGQFQGIVVDRLYDLQIAINRGEMNRQDVMARSAKGGMILDEAILGGDESKKDIITQSMNDPSARIWVDEGSTKNLPGGGILPLPQSNVPFDQVNALSQYYDMSDRFSKVPAAMDARQESAKESGKLFRYKFEAGQVAQKFLMKIVEQHSKDKANAYYEQAKVTYRTGTRVFQGTKSGKPVVINTAKTDEFNLASMPRLKVSVIPSPDGISVRNEQKNEFGEMLSLLVGPNDQLMKTIVMGWIIDLAEMPDKKRQEAKKAIELTTLVNAFDMKAKMVQAQSMIQQAQAPMQPMPPAGQAIPDGSVPPSGEEVPPMPEESNQPAPQGA